MEIKITAGATGPLQNAATAPIIYNKKICIGFPLRLSVKNISNASHIIKTFNISAEAVLDQSMNITVVDKIMADKIPVILLKRRLPIIKVIRMTPIPEIALGSLEENSVTTPCNEKGNISQ